MLINHFLFRNDVPTSCLEIKTHRKHSLKNNPKILTTQKCPTQHPLINPKTNSNKSERNSSQNKPKVPPPSQLDTLRTSKQRMGMPNSIYRGSYRNHLGHLQRMPNLCEHRESFFVLILDRLREFFLTLSGL